MRKFRIIPISHSLKGNVIGKSGQVVLESQLSSPAEDLISAKFIEEVFDDKLKVVVEDDVKASEAVEEIEVVEEEVISRKELTKEDVLAIKKSPKK